MPTEIEAKFLNINIDEVRAKLKAGGAHLEHPMRLMRREHFDYPDERYKHAKEGGTDERLRIRDEGNKVTVTYKKSSVDSNYAAEVEIVADSYDAARQLLTAIGLHSFNYQETKRETWQFEDAEVVIDEWPWLAPYIEIEGPNEETIKAAAKRLGFDWNDAKFGSVDTAYEVQYKKWSAKDSIGFVPIVKFGLPLPDYLKERM